MSGRLSSHATDRVLTCIGRSSHHGEFVKFRRGKPFNDLKKSLNLQTNEVKSK
jgi:hypothetical protein